MIDYKEIGEKCVNYLFNTDNDQISWSINENNITVNCGIGTPLSGRLHGILMKIEIKRLKMAKTQQESFIERYEMDKLLGRFQ